MDLRYYWLREVELDGIPLIVSRTGWSSELGYELYLRDGSQGDALWERIMAAGMAIGLKPGHTSSIRRIEGGMLSYHADADINTNPFELGFDRLVNLDMEADFIGKAALRRIRDEGRKPQPGRPGDRRRTADGSEHHLLADQPGRTERSARSPRRSIRRALRQNIALAMVSVTHANLGAEVEVVTHSGLIAPPSSSVRSTTPRRSHRRRLNARPSDPTHVRLPVNCNRADPRANRQSMRNGCNQHRVDLPPIGAAIRPIPTRTGARLGAVSCHMMTFLALREGGWPVASYGRGAPARAVS